MTDPIDYPDKSPRFGLPLLHAGQAQKEVFVNDGLATIDRLLHGAIEGEAAAPPVGAAEGAMWLVGEDATGDWAGHEGTLAWRSGGAWRFFVPCDGMRVFDRTRGCDLRFSGSWRKPDHGVEPNGGTTVDIEARAAITSLVASLRAMGVLSSG